MKKVLALSSPDLSAFPVNQSVEYTLIQTLPDKSTRPLVLLHEHVEEDPMFGVDLAGTKFAGILMTKNNRLEIVPMTENHLTEYLTGEKRQGQRRHPMTRDVLSMDDIVCIDFKNKTTPKLVPVSKDIRAFFSGVSQVQSGGSVINQGNRGEDLDTQSSSGSVGYQPAIDPSLLSIVSTFQDVNGRPLATIPRDLIARYSDPTLIPPEFISLVKQRLHPFLAAVCHYNNLTAQSIFENPDRLFDLIPSIRIKPQGPLDRLRYFGRGLADWFSLTDLAQSTADLIGLNDRVVVSVKAAKLQGKNSVWAGLKAWGASVAQVGLRLIPGYYAFDYAINGKPVDWTSTGILDSAFFYKSVGEFLYHYDVSRPAEAPRGAVAFLARFSSSSSFLSGHEEGDPLLSQRSVRSDH